ncbi:MAG: carboxypeptidase regulatory-like domain-containing protein, partial [Blastocatellia bacterium]
ATGFNTSNVCEIEIAPPAGLAPPQVTGFSAASTQAGQTITINGSGFSPNPAENLVRIGGVEASVKSANPVQLQVIAPFGAGTGRVSVRTPGGEGISANALAIRTSISGVVETASRQPLRGVNVKVAGANISAVTDAEGAFILPGVAPGAALIEIDAGAVSTSPRYPKITLAMNAGANRDNQYPTPIALQPETNKGINIGAAGLENAGSVSAAAEENGAIQSGNVTFEVPVGARVSFPDGSSSGTLYLTVVEQSRTPVSLPAGHFSSTIAQITPFGAKLDVGGKLIFPNADGLPAGTEARLYRFDQRQGSPTIGRFVESGTAAVSADGQRIETADGLIIEATYYFVSAAHPTTTVIGRVIESNGNPARRVVARSRGQEAFTDGNGGFILRNVPVRNGEQIAVEASLHRPKGRIDRARRDNVAVTASGVTSVAPDIVLPNEDTNRPPVLVAPTTLSATAGQTTDVDFVANDLEGRVARVTVSGAGFASVVSRSDNSYVLRLAPGVNDAKSYDLTLTATDEQNLSTSQPISLAVIPPPPAIADFNPKSARVGEVVT